LPELPEVETVRRGLQPVMEGAAFRAVHLRRPDLRFPFPENFAARLTGRRMVALGRRAKYLAGDLDDGTVLVMHLGMSGSFRYERAEASGHPGDFHHPRGKDAVHDHVVFEMDSGWTVTYNDPRRFGFMTLVERARFDEHPLFAGLGPEPLGNALSTTALAGSLAGRATSLKAVLMDQRTVAGLGNIYVAEALWRARLSPRRAAGTLVRADGRPTERLERLAGAIRETIADAVEAGGSSLRDYVQADGTLGLFQHRFAVYDREDEPCLRPACRGVVKRIVQTGRSTYYCPVCQK
jgi:formamidopyrimidine-DNA glycosylase